MATQTSLNVAPHPDKPGTDIPLPKWNDFSSVVSYLTSIVAIGVGLFAAFQPGFKEPATVQAAIPAVALVIATGAQIINAWSHRHAHNLAAVALIQRGNPVLPAPPRKTVIQAQGELALERTQGAVLRRRHPSRLRHLSRWPPARLRRIRRPRHLRRPAANPLRRVDVTGSPWSSSGHHSGRHHSCSRIMQNSLPGHSLRTLRS